MQGSGIEYVDIDLWNSEIRFGPLTIGVPRANPVRKEQFGLKCSLSRLFSRRRLGKESIVEGLILDVAHDSAGRIAVNSIGIFGLLPQSDPGPSGEEGDSVWGV